MTHTISFLGSWIEERNPKGWWIFSIGMSITSLMFIPLFLFIFEKMKHILVWGAYIGFILGIIACIGLFLIALFPDNEDLPLYKDLSWGKIHDTIATIAILSFFLDIIWYGILIIIDEQTTQYLPNNTLWIPFYLSMVLIVIFGITQVKWSIKCKNDPNLEPFPGEGIYSFPLWEWILFFLLFLNLYWFVFSIPL